MTRWRRYGKDRLSVNDDQGADVGWWDLITDEAHPAAPELHPALAEAVTRWRSEQSSEPTHHLPQVGAPSVVRDGSGRSLAAEPSAPLVVPTPPEPGLST